MPGPAPARVGCETQNQEPKVAALSLGTYIYNISKTTAHIKGWSPQGGNGLKTEMGTAPGGEREKKDPTISQ